MYVDGVNVHNVHRHNVPVEHMDIKMPPVHM